MPTYTYRCNECNHTFDVFHSMSENGTRVCPECGAEAYRLIGAGAGLLFKGSGFYETDYKKKSNGNGSNGSHYKSPSSSVETPKSETKDSGTKSESKTESTTKPEKKTAAAK